MVQMNENNPEYEPKVKPERETLLKKFDIPIDHLDFKYLETCENGKEIEKILQILLSGEEGFFPDLLKFTEKRLLEVYPKSKFLQTAVPVLSKYDIPKDEWQELSSDLQNWVEDVGKNDKELISFHDIKPNMNNVPVRESQFQKNMQVEKKTERIKSMDYDAWDKLDVDTEILKMDIKDEKIKEKALKKAEEKEKINTVVLNPDIMTKAELNHAAIQAKNTGNECYKSGDYEEAFQYYTNSLTFLPTATVYNNRAITNIKLKNYEDALKDCNEVLKLEKGNEKAYLRKSKAHKCLKQYDKAIETLEILLQINPNSIDAQNMIQDIKKICGKNEKIRTVRMKIQEGSNENNIAKEESNLKNMETIPNGCKNKNILEVSKKYKEENVKHKKKETSNKNVVIKEIIEERSDKNAILKKNINNKNIKTKTVIEKESRDNVLIPIPSTSKCAGPFYRVVNVPSDIAKKITSTKKTHSKSDENVIDLNLPENSIKKKTPNKPLEDVDSSNFVEKIKLDIKENQNKVHISKKCPLATLPEKKIRDTNFTPYEFLKHWQAIKCDPTLQEHEKLLRSLNPLDLVDVLGNKLDGDMFTLLLKCLETWFTKEEDNIFVGNILTELTKIARIDIIMLLMNGNDKNILRNLIERVKNYGFIFQENVYQEYRKVIKV